MRLKKVGENVLSFKKNNVLGYIFSVVFVIVGFLVLFDVFETPTTIAKFGFGLLAIILGIFMVLFIKRTSFVANRTTQQIKIISKSLVKKEEAIINFNDVRGILVIGYIKRNLNSRSSRSSRSINYDVMLKTINGDFNIYSFSKNLSTFSALTSSFKESAYSPPTRVSSKLKEIATFIGVAYAEQNPQSIGETIRGVVNSFTGNNTNQTSLNETNQGFNQNNNEFQR